MQPYSHTAAAPARMRLQLQPLQLRAHAGGQDASVPRDGRDILEAHGNEPLGAQPVKEGEYVEGENGGH